MTDYEYSEQHMKAVFSAREPLSLAPFREEHWDKFIRKVKAEAWAEGFDAHDQDWKHHDANNWGDEDCLDVTYNPYED